MKKSWKISGWLCTFALAATAMAPGTAFGGDAKPRQKVDNAATLRWVGTTTLSQWDPTRGINLNADYPYYTQVYDRLLQLKSDNTLAPALATSWNFSPDGRTLTMQLRKDVKFHDGGAFDATNAVANLNRNRASGILSTTLRGIQGVSAVDPYTIRIDLAKNDPSILYWLAGTPSSMVSPAGLADPSSLTSKPAGSGPYKFASLAGTTVTLERNDDYWDKSRAYAPTKTMTVITDDAARLNSFKTGTADFGNLRPTQLPEIQQLVKANKYKFRSFPTFAQYMVYVNGNKAPLNNPAVRQAISMAIDRQTISDTLLNGLCPPSRELIPKGFVGYLPEDDRNIYNVKKARQTLKKAGVEPFTVNALAVDSGSYSQVAAVVQEQLKQIGITVNLTTAPLATMRSTWRKGEQDMMIFAYTPSSPDAIGVLDADYLGPDGVGAPVPELTALVEAARPEPIGSKSREAALQKINKYLNEEPLHVPICQLSGVTTYNPKVVGADDVPNTALSADVPDTRNLYVGK